MTAHPAAFDPDTTGTPATEPCKVVARPTGKYSLSGTRLKQVYCQTCELVVHRGTVAPVYQATQHRQAVEALVKPGHKGTAR